jgi:hypothetical protein
MTTIQRDNSDGGDISRSITWQFDNAEKLCALIDSLGNFYRASTKDFHDSITDSLVDLERADDFGLSVWGKLLNCKRPILAPVGSETGYQSTRYGRFVRTDDIPSGVDRSYYQYDYCWKSRNYIMLHGVAEHPTQCLSFYAVFPISSTSFNWADADNRKVIPYSTRAEVIDEPDEIEFIVVGKEDIFVKFGSSGPDFAGGVLSTELYRRVLAARLRLLNSNGSIDAFCNAILDEFDNRVSVISNGDMSITFGVKPSATAEEAQLISQFPDVAFIYPAGIRNNTPATATVFGLSGQEEDTTYTVGGLDESSFFWK